MKRAIVCVATTNHYQRGMQRLAQSCSDSGTPIACWNKEPDGSPKHSEVPYAFKAYALQHAAEHADLLLWADACILPLRDMTPLWERIEREGYWICNNGWSNYEWTADSAYPDLFRAAWEGGPDMTMEQKRNLNRSIQHVVATTFGLNVRHPMGAAFLREYFRLASTTKAFCGPWVNFNYEKKHGFPSDRIGMCGPPDVRGHRHDQTAASVIAWRLGMKLTDPPDPFAYAKFRPGGTFCLEDQDERTILCAHGSY